MQCIECSKTQTIGYLLLHRGIIHVHVCQCVICPKKVGRSSMKMHACKSYSQCSSSGSNSIKGWVEPSQPPQITPWLYYVDITRLSHYPVTSHQENCTAETAHLQRNIGLHQKVYEFLSIISNTNWFSASKIKKTRQLSSLGYLVLNVIEKNWLN